MTKPKVLIAISKMLSARVQNDLEPMSNEFQKINFFTYDINNCLTLLGLVKIYIEDLKKIYTVMAIIRKNLTTVINRTLNRAKKSTWNI